MGFISACNANGNIQKKLEKPKIITQKNNHKKLTENENLNILNYHNKIRATVNLKPLNWSNKIAHHAQNWAKNLADQGCNLQHNSDSSYGENLFMGTLGHYSVIDAVKSWESEKSDYSGNFLNSANWRKIGHYTQIVWRNTTQLGCAKMVCNNNLIVVCNYNPAGNYMGQKPY